MNKRLLTENITTSAVKFFLSIRVQRLLHKSLGNDDASK